MLVFEHKLLYGRKGEVDDGGALDRSGKRRASRAQGADVTIVAAMRAVETRSRRPRSCRRRIEAEVIDLRSCGRRGVGSRAHVRPRPRAIGRQPRLATTVGLPFFHLGALDVGLPIQTFGVIVAVGVLIGAACCAATPSGTASVRRSHPRPDRLGHGLRLHRCARVRRGRVLLDRWRPTSWREPDPDSSTGRWLKIWDGISSYGGFLGGAIGLAIYVWWKRLPVRLLADIAIVGLLPAFSIGRIGCTVVSDHIGAAVDARSWYAVLAMDYPSRAQPRAVTSLGALIRRSRAEHQCSRGTSA